MKPVTDPALLEQLNGKGPVSDPVLLAQLNGKGKAQAAMDAERARLKGDLDNEYGGIKGYVANFGAGMDNVWQGAKQLVGQGRNDEDIAEDRGLKDQLADTVPLGGLTQVAGEMVGSAPLTMGVGGAAGKLATKALPKASAWAASKGGRAFNLGTVGRGAVEGAAGGALTETNSEESKGAYSTVGAALGAATPAVLAGGKGLVKTLSKSGEHSSNRAAKLLEKQLGKDNMSQIADVVDSPATTHLPLSTAAKSQNVALASLERGARSRSDWGFDHDRQVAEKAWEMVKSGTTNADDLTARTAGKEGLVKSLDKNLASKTKAPGLAEARQDIADVAEKLRQTPAARQTPEVTKVLGQVEEMLQHPEAHAGDFAVQYRRLQSMLDGSTMGDEAKQVLGQLKDAVYAAGNKSTGRKTFSKVLARVDDATSKVDESVASKNVRETFVSPEGVPLTAQRFGDTPEVTSHALRKSLAKNPQVGRGLDPVEKELSRHELWKGGNATGPSNLNMNDPLTALSSRPIGGVFSPKGIAHWFMGGANRATVESADKAMQSPEAWKKMMEEYARSKTPLTPQEYAARLRRQLTMAPGKAAIAGLGED
jgi:hypothetical protein